MSNLRELSLLLYTNSRLLIQMFQLRLSPFNLTYTQYLTLSVLWEEDGLYVNEIGKQLDLDSGTLTPLIKKLESQNYVKRIRSEEDERKVKVELTYTGRSLQNQVNESLQETEKDFADGSDLELNTFSTAMELLQGKLRDYKESL